jgi:hypothetical protein
MYKIIYVFLTFFLITCSASDNRDVKSHLIGKWSEKLPETEHFVFLRHFYTFTQDSFFVRSTYTDDTRLDFQIDNGKGIYTLDKNYIILIGELYSSYSARNLIKYNDSLKKEIFVPDTIGILLVSNSFINEKYKYHFCSDTLFFTDSLKSREYCFLRD